MSHIIRFVIMALIMVVPVSSYCGDVDLYPAGHVHTVPPEDRIVIPDNLDDEFRFKGYKGEACPYHVKVSTKTYVEDIIKEEEREKEIRYSVRLDVKNDSPCLFVNIYLHMRLTDREGDVVREAEQLLNYLPSYSSNVFYTTIWLPVYVNPKELTFGFEYEQLHE